MRVTFFEPPATRAEGGLALAMASLEAYLLRAGVAVRRNPPAAALQPGKAEVVHFHGLWEARFPGISARCRRVGIPYVVSPHGMLQPWEWAHKRWKKWPWFYLVERRHLAGAARLLATAEPEARRLERFFPDRKALALDLGVASDHAPDYAAARRALGWAAHEIVLLYLSRVHPKKGLDLLLKALAAATPDMVARLRLVIVGDGESRYVDSLKALARSSAGAAIDWQGAIWGAGKWPYLQGADLFCLPSFSENFGLSVLEALQVGTRVLTTDRTPWAALAPRSGAFIAPPTAGGVGRALAQFLAQPAWSAEQRAALAAETMRRFSWEAIGPSYLRLYEDVVRGARSC
jgi:glycosyltransferase involved in cell wall biosynthesis